MKGILRCLVLFVSFAYVFNVNAQESTEGVPLKNEGSGTAAPTSPNDNKSESSLKGSELLPQALQLFLAKKFNESLEVIDQILKINPNNHDALNLKGANYTKMKNWSAAESAYRQALSVAPMAFEPKFNLAELLFLQGQYPAARQAFAAILPIANRDIYKHLTEFKIFMTYLLEDRIESAMEIAKKYDGFESTPIYYFIEGALAHKKGDSNKATHNYSAAIRIFPPYLNHNFLDTLAELGWIPSSGIITANSLSDIPPTKTSTITSTLIPTQGGIGETQKVLDGQSNLFPSSQ